MRRTTKKYVPNEWDIKLALMLAWYDEWKDKRDA